MTDRDTQEGPWAETVSIVGDEGKVCLAHSYDGVDDDYISPINIDALLYSGATFVDAFLRGVFNKEYKQDRLGEVEVETRAVVKVYDNRRNVKVRRIEKHLAPEGKKTPLKFFSSDGCNSAGPIVIHGLQNPKNVLSSLRKFGERSVVLSCAGGVLPWWNPKEDEQQNEGEEEIEIYKSVAPRACAILSVSGLQRQGAIIDTKLSWEQIVEDIGAELALFNRMLLFRRFSTVLLRVGKTGVVRIANKDGERSGWLYFVPRGPEEQRYQHVRKSGTVLGKNSILIASILREMTRAKTTGRNVVALGDLSDSEWDNAILAGLSTIRAVHEIGYDFGPFEEGQGRKSPQERGVELLESLCRTVREEIDIFHERRSDGGTDQRRKEDPIVSKKIPTYIWDRPHPDRLRSSTRWRILNESLREAPYHRVNIALAIAKMGHEAVLNADLRNFAEESVRKTLCRVEYIDPRDQAADHLTLQDGEQPHVPDPFEERYVKGGIIGSDAEQFPSIVVPLASFGKMTLVEREEIETMRSIANLFRVYVDKEDAAASPVSIAIFGKPGSGKSFAVKQIQAEIDKRNEKTTWIEYNLAQFKSPDDLGLALTAVTSAGHGRTPIVFFDEFDCSLGSKPLGWLQYFLAPMQDGVFYSENQAIKTGRGIFVFAGGVHSSFEAFDPRSHSPHEALGSQAQEDYRQRVKLFAEQKGPDFISRLRGHINVQEINAPPGQAKHLIRRALQLRGLLERHKYLTSGRASIRDEVLYALLTVDHYRHGVRSMEAVLGMCVGTENQLSSASLPSHAQLNMHVDPENFLRRVYRGRVRAYDPSYASIVKTLSKK